LAPAGHVEIQYFQRRSPAVDCSQPPPLSDDQLLLLLDGEGDSSIHEHISDCAYCRSQARSLQNFQAQVKAGLYRGRCPTPLELGEYQQNLLSRELRREIKYHLETCTDCIEELDQLTDYLTGRREENTLTPVRSLKILVARLASGLAGPSGPGQLTPAFSGLRGSDAGPSQYKVDDFEITIDIQPTPDKPAERTLYGLLLGEIKPGYSITLVHGSGEVTNGHLDSLGNFVLTGLSPGKVDLVVQGADFEIHIPDLEV
jgi:hypothetical protein